MSLLKHLMNAPVAIALAFLLVGIPAAPVAELLPTSGDVAAYDPLDPAGPNYDPCGSGLGQRPAGR